MSYVIERFGREQQYVYFCRVENTSPLPAGEGNVILPSGKAITGEKPVNTHQEVEDENESGYEMSEAYPAKPVVVDRRCSVHDGWRVSYDVSRNTQYNDTQGIYPVEDTYGKLPYIHFCQMCFFADHCSSFKQIYIVSNWCT